MLTLRLFQQPPHTTVAPEFLPTTTNFPANSPINVAPEPNPTMTTTTPSNPPTTDVPEPDTTTTICVYVNPHTRNAHVPDPTPPHTTVAPIPDTPSPTTSTTTLVADFHRVKWYNYKYVIYLYEVPSL